MTIGRERKACVKQSFHNHHHAYPEDTTAIRISLPAQDKYIISFFEKKFKKIILTPSLEIGNEHHTSSY